MTQPNTEPGEWTIEENAWDGCDGQTNYIKAGSIRIASVSYLPGAQQIVSQHHADLAALRREIAELTGQVRHFEFQAEIRIKDCEALQQRLATAEADSRSLLDDICETAFTGCTKFGAKHNTCNCACDHVVNMIRSANRQSCRRRGSPP